MKKLNLLLSLMLLNVINMSSMAQKATRTSIANGNFYMPTTWDCGCIPASTDNIVINTKVVLDYDLAQTGGNITINSSGSLKKSAVATRQFLFSSNGTFTNNGVFNVDRFAITFGIFVNNDSLAISRALSNGSTLINNGKILQVDSFYTNGTLTNNQYGQIYTVGFANEGTYTNKGHHFSTEFYNTAIVNQKRYLY